MIAAVAGLSSGAAACGETRPAAQAQTPEKSGMDAFALWSKPRSASDRLPPEAVRAFHRSPAKDIPLNFARARRLPTRGVGHSRIWAVPGPTISCLMYAFRVRRGPSAAFAVQCGRNSDAARNGIAGVAAPGALRDGTVNFGLVPDDVIGVSIEGREIPVVGNAYAMATRNPVGLTLLRRDGSRQAIQLRGF